ncbi:MAG: glycosyltransferase family 4 protein [Opitutaceae bacterium]
MALLPRKLNPAVRSPLKLLYVHESLGSLGGAEANVFITATELRKRGHQVGLLTRRATGRNEEAWRELFGENIFWVDRTGYAEAAAAFSPDVTYVHKWDHLTSLADIVQSGRARVRMVHDHDMYCLRSYRYNPLTREVCHRPTSAYCVFPCLASLKRDREGPLPFKFVSYTDKKRERDLSRHFHRHLVVTRYMQEELEINGFDAGRIEIFPPVPRAAAGLEPSFSDRNLLIWAGQIIRGKGLDVLLQALTQVKQPFELIVLGDGNHKAVCEELSRKLGLADRVTFAGFVPQETMRNYYRDASLFVLSSLWPEPIATIGLEVMRFALPVVAWDAGGIKDWLIDGHNGYLVPWKDTTAYAARVDELLADKAKARQMGQAGLALVNEHYDFESYLSRLEDLFSRVAVEPEPATQ